jgi:hypothetical protein
MNSGKLNRCCNEALPKEPTNLLYEIPDEVKDAAILVEKWFKEHNLKRWQMFGICSRNYAYDFETIESLLIFSKIEKGEL